MSEATQPAPLVEFTLVPKGTLIKPEAALTIEQAFAPYVEQFQALRATVATITDPKEAKTTRLKLRKVRTDTEKKHQEMKAESLNYGRTLDHAKNLINGQIEPIEEQLEAIEKAEERRIAALLAERRQQHLAALAPYLDPALPAPFVDGMTDAQFAIMLDNHKTLHAARLEKAKREQQEREEAERRRLEEQERIREENDRLREEALQQEEKLRAEREKTENLTKEIRAIHYQQVVARSGRLGVRKGGTIECIRETLAETEAWEIDPEHFEHMTSAAQEAKEAAIGGIKFMLAEEERKERAKVEYEKQVKEQQEQRAKEQKERERQEAEAKKRLAEAEKKEAAAKKERDRLEAEAAEARRKQAEAERLQREAAQREADRLAAERDAEQRRLQAEADAAEKAAQAPDKAKLQAYAKAIMAVPTPELKTRKAKRMSLDFIGGIQDLATSLEEATNKL